MEFFLFFFRFLRISINADKSELHWMRFGWNIFEIWERLARHRIGFVVNSLIWETFKEWLRMKMQTARQTNINTRLQWNRRSKMFFTHVDIQPVIEHPDNIQFKIEFMKTNPTERQTNKHTFLSQYKFNFLIAQHSTHKIICYVNNNLWSHWIYPKYLRFRRMFWQMKRLFLREIYCQCSKDTFLHFALVARYNINRYINNCGWSRKFWSSRPVVENENRREPIKSSLRLPVLRNRFFILALTAREREATRKHLEKWYKKALRRDFFW